MTQGKVSSQMHTDAEGSRPPPLSEIGEGARFFADFLYHTLKSPHLRWGLLRQLKTIRQGLRLADYIKAQPNPITNHRNAEHNQALLQTPVGGV